MEEKKRFSTSSWSCKNLHHPIALGSNKFFEVKRSFDEHMPLLTDKKILLALFLQ